jgi:hypothetical protein
MKFEAGRVWLLRCSRMFLLNDVGWRVTVSVVEIVLEGSTVSGQMLVKTNSTGRTRRRLLQSTLSTIIWRIVIILRWMRRRLQYITIWRIVIVHRGMRCRLLYNTIGRIIVMYRNVVHRRFLLFNVGIMTYYMRGTTVEIDIRKHSLMTYGLHIKELTW